MSDEWLTPKYIFDAMNVTFDLDVAAPRNGKTHVPCNMFCFENSLTESWSGFIWMNPPFGGRNGITPWLNKFFDHGDGVALVPDRTSAPWFQNAAHRAGLVLFLSPKVKFERADGSLGKSPSTGTALMAIGRQGKGALLSARKLGWLAEGL